MLINIIKILPILQVFAFDRTVSRLLEMQAVEYVQSCQTAHPQGPAWILRTVQEQMLLKNGKEGSHVSVVDAYGRDLLKQLLTSANASAASAEAKLWEAFVRQLWAQYRIGSIDEAHNQPVATATTPAEQVLRWDDAAVCLADLAAFATQMIRSHSFSHSHGQTKHKSTKEKNVSEEEGLVQQVQEKVLPDRLEALAQRCLSNDWGHYFATSSALSQEARELLSQIAHLRR